MCVLLCFQIILLLVAIYNTCAYMIPLRISNPMIILFYVIAYMVTIFYSLSTIFLIQDPHNFFYSYAERPSMDISVIAWDIADCQMITLGLLILAMTVRIILAIHELYGGIERSTVTIV